MKKEKITFETIPEDEKDFFVKFLEKKKP